MRSTYGDISVFLCMIGDRSVCVGVTCLDAGCRRSVSSCWRSVWTALTSVRPAWSAAWRRGGGASTRPPLDFHLTTTSTPCRPGEVHTNPPITPFYCLLLFKCCWQVFCGIPWLWGPKKVSTQSTMVCEKVLGIIINLYSCVLTW